MHLPYINKYYNDSKQDCILQVKGKVALRTGGWFKAAPVPRFQTLAPDWPTGPDMPRLPLSS
ncbi:hypothetical protein T10_10085 [Trichinella papuae]|uniref:Uncharacterized protein n=1 Tax=Trichinella papuae TaxID=268474 RepID=A0A0V1MTR8_9BILA|nr:hypothetical protein T10_10085 [Trichinella papuae]